MPDKKLTEELLNELLDAPSIDDYIKEHDFAAPSLSEYLKQLLEALIINFIRTLPGFIRTCSDESGNPIP